MKNLKKSLVTLLACTMALAPCMLGNLPASAADGNSSIVITNTDTATHTYDAYQLFSGTIVNGSLWGVDWGDGVNGTALLEDLKNPAVNGDYATLFTNCGSAYDVAGVLEANQGTSGFSEAFAEVVSKHLNALNKKSASGASSVTIEGLAIGYYFVKDADGTLANQDGAYTRFILKLLENTASVTAKSKSPTLDKVINEGNGIDANTASIGDNVPFKLTSAVPDMAGYNKYYFVVNDTLSAGFDFNNDVAITIGTTNLGANDFYVVEEDGGKVKIVIKNFVKYANEKGKPIVITYSATLDEDANLGTTGNTNIVNLTYSNDPNFDYTGIPGSDNGTPEDTSDDIPANPDEPNPGNPGNPDDPDDDVPGEPTGNTPPDKTVTYATTLQIIKVDGGNTATKLQGAKFTLEKGTVDDQGTFTILEGTTATELTTGTDGLATFAGLGEGTYKITEVTPPANYNGLTDSIIVTLDATATVSSITWEDDRTEDDLVFENNTFKITIENNKGSSLPTTGGMGTTMIYVAGTMLVLLSIVVIITRKRMESRQF